VYQVAPKVLGDYKKAARTLHNRWDGLDAKGRADALLEAVVDLIGEAAS